MSGLKYKVLLAGFMLLVAAPFAAAQVWGVDRDTTVGELASFDHFLDNHPRMQADLYRNPGLIRDARYMREHPELREYMATHPGMREELRENPRAFMRGERWYERQEDGAAWRPRDARFDGDHDRDDRWRDRDDWRWRNNAWRNNAWRNNGWRGNGWRDGDHDRDDGRRDRDGRYWRHRGNGWRDGDHDRDDRHSRDRDDWRRHQRREERHEHDRH